MGSCCGSITPSNASLKNDEPLDDGNCQEDKANDKHNIKVVEIPDDCLNETEDCGPDGNYTVEVISS